MKASGSMPEIEGSIALDEPMSAHTSFKIGGPADVFAVCKNLVDLTAMLKWARARSLPVFVLGAGTNLLVSDKGIRGLVVELGSGFEDVQVRDTVVRAGATAKLSRVMRKSLGRGLSGLEGLAGIPGTVGGAICMNAGTPLGCIKDTLESVVTINALAKIQKKPASELGLTYRGSAVQESGLIITEAVFRLEQKEPDEINEIVETMLSKRKYTQPVGIGTAGSTFKNPPDEYAGQILENLGAKGMQVGGARVSRKHANFIENTGSASAEDVSELMIRLQRLAKEKASVDLEPEINIVGEW